MSEKGPNRFWQERSEKARAEADAQKNIEKQQRADAAKNALAASRSKMTEGVSESVEGYEKLYEKNYAVGEYNPEGIENVDLNRKGIVLKGSTDSFWFKEKPQSEAFYKELYADARMMMDLYSHLKINNVSLEEEGRLTEMLDKLVYIDNMPSHPQKYSHENFLSTLEGTGYTKSEIYGSNGLLNLILAFRRAASTRIDTGKVDSKGRKVFKVVRRKLSAEDFKSTDESPAKFKAIELNLNTLRSQDLRATKIVAEKVKAQISKEALKSTMHPYEFLKNFAIGFPKNFDASKYQCVSSRDGILVVKTTKGEEVVTISLKTLPGKKYKLILRGQDYSKTEIDYAGKATAGVAEQVQKEISAFEKPRNSQEFHKKTLEYIQANDSKFRENHIHFETPNIGFDYKAIVDNDNSNVSRLGSRVYDIKINGENRSLEFYKTGGGRKLGEVKIDFGNISKTVDAIRILHGEN